MSISHRPALNINMILARKTHNFSLNFQISQCFGFGPKTYAISLKFTLRKRLAITRKLYQSIVKNHTLLKSYGRLGSSMFWDTLYFLIIVCFEDDNEL